MRNVIESYLFLRRFIGLVGIVLPFFVTVWVLVFSGVLLTSVSASYHTGMRDVFVGGMWAIGVFLIFYQGPDRADGSKVDDRLGTLAGLAAIAVAVLPTRPPKGATDAEIWVGIAHIAASAAFFLLLAGFCWFRFPTDDTAPGSTVYKVCAGLIVLWLVCIGVFGFLFEEQSAAWHPVLFFEALASITFGYAWFRSGKHMKGGDDPAPPPPGDEAEPPAEPAAMAG